MPDKRSGQNLEDAALSAWERGAGDTPDPAPHPKRARVKALFEALPEVAELERVLSGAMNDPAKPIPLTIEVQPGLLQLLAHIEQIDAGRAGRPPSPPHRLLSQAVSNQLEDLLHRLITDPTNHPHYAQAWNALCAAEEALDLTIPDGMAPGGPEKGKEGPF